MKLYTCLEWCEAAATRNDDFVKTSFYHRGSVLGLFEGIDQNRKALILKAPKGQTIDFPRDAETGLYLIPLGLIRALEKAPSRRRHERRHKSRRDGA